MNRRAFLGALLGAGAVVATEAVAPSLVWPFRKYFLPSNWMRWIGVDVGCIPPGSLVTTQGFTHLANNGIWQVTDAEVTLFDKAIPDLYGHGISEMAVEAIELEAFAKEIPDLIYKGTPTYELFKKRALMLNEDFPQSFTEKMRVPMRITPENPRRIADIHAKATVDNVMRFIDDLQSKS